MARSRQKKVDVFWRLEKWVPKSDRGPGRWEVIGTYTTKRWAQMVKPAYHGRMRIVRQVGLEKK